MLTGDGLVAVDVDLYHPDGESSFERLRELGLPIETVTQITGGGGRHYLYRMNVHDAVREPLAGFPGIDVKATAARSSSAPAPIPTPASRTNGNTPGGPATSSRSSSRPSSWPCSAPPARSTIPARSTSATKRAVNLLLEHFGGHHPRVRAAWVEVCRPGKDDGCSATVGALGPGIVKVWSSNWPGLPAGVYSLHELRRLAGVDEPPPARPRPRRRRSCAPPE